MRIALVVGRDLGENRSWGTVLRDLLSEGHSVVAAAQRLPEELVSPRSSYEIFPRDIRTDHYLSVPIQNGSEKELSRYHKDSAYPETHSILMGMLSRRDPTGTFRALDREVVIRHLHLVLMSQLMRAQPTHMVFEETPHEIVDFALFRLAEWLAIPVLHFQPSLIGPQVVARSSLSQIVDVACPLVGPRDLELTRSSVRSICLAAFSKLLAGNGTIRLEKQKRKDYLSSRPLHRANVIRYLLRRIGKTPSNRLVNLTGHVFLPERIRRVLEVVLEWSLRQSLNKTIAGLPSKPEKETGQFAIFALHYEPERTSMPEGLPYRSQLDAVLDARAILPPEISLLVKEHYAQQSPSWRGFVGRSPYAYDLLNSIPGVEVLGVNADTLELLKSAICVFTMTGKIGLEAAGAGTPIVYLGEPWWRGMPGSFALDDLDGDASISGLTETEQVDLELWFDGQVSSRLLVGLGATSPEKYSRHTASLPEGFEQLEAQAILAAISTVWTQAATPRS